MEEPPYRVNIDGVEDANADSTQGTRRDRPWVGIQFDCCNVYVRVYRNADATAYEGRCPRCTRKLRLRVGPSGTASRFFVAE